LNARFREFVETLLNLIDATQENRARGLLLADSGRCGHPLEHALLKGRVLIQEQRPLHRPANGRRVASRVRTVVRQDLELVLHFLGRPAHVRRVAVLRRDAERTLLSAAADEDWRGGALAGGGGRGWR